MTDRGTPGKIALLKVDNGAGAMINVEAQTIPNTHQFDQVDTTELGDIGEDWTSTLERLGIDPVLFWRVGATGQARLRELFLANQSGSGAENVETFEFYPLGEVTGAPYATFEGKVTTWSPNPNGPGGVVQVTPHIQLTGGAGVTWATVA